MVQSAQPDTGKNGTGGCGALPVVRCALPEPKVCTVLMIVADIIREEALKMAFVHRNHVIQKLSPALFNSLLRNSVLPRTLK